MTTCSAAARPVCRDPELANCDPYNRLSSTTAQPLIVQSVNANGARACLALPSFTVLYVNILIVALGTISVLANTIAVTQTGRIAFTGAGFWCNLLFVITGSLGASAARSKTRCMIVSHLVMCVASASFTLLQFTVTIVKSYVDDYPIYTCHPHCAQIGVRVAVGMYFIITVCSLVNTILATICAVICCKTLCCTKTPQTTYVYLQGGQQAQYIEVNQSSSTAVPTHASAPYPSGGEAPGPPPQVSSAPTTEGPPAYTLNPPPPYSYFPPQL